MWSDQGWNLIFSRALNTQEIDKVSNLLEILHSWAYNNSVALETYMEDQTPTQNFLLPMVGY